MATMKDVARRAGVSIATVSHVLNQTRTLRPQTQERVHRAARDLGYVSNAAARNLAIGHSSILGLVISDIRNPFFPEITTAFQDLSLSQEIDTIVMNTNYDSHRTRACVNRLLALQVTGAAILTSQIDSSIIELLSERKVCAVYLDLGRVDRWISNIVVDYAQGIVEALEHLRGLGHEQIGFIGGPPHLWSARRRKKAFLDCAAKGGHALGKAIDSDFTVQGGYFACAKLLSSFAPTAIVAANDLMAIGALHCAYDRGLKVPSDISIIGFDDILFAQHTQPALTTVAVPRAEIGRLAFHALWEMISEKAEFGVEHRVATQLVVRQSTANRAR
jgi:DNA-binding LacI/PurR family transcriptional regulator